jgi:hypothetical protein
MSDALRIWLDTSVARSVKNIRALCRLARKKGVRVKIHPQVYLERRRQLRAELAAKGKVFDEGAFDDLLEREGIAVPPFTLDQHRAGIWADTLHARYPSDGEWESAKQRTLGGELAKAFAVQPGLMPMTTDWLIALVVEHEASARVITNDHGEEWLVLRDAEPRRALRWDEAIAWLEELPDAAPSSRPGVDP